MENFSTDHYSDLEGFTFSSDDVNCFSLHGMLMREDEFTAAWDLLNTYLMCEVATPAGGQSLTRPIHRDSTFSYYYIGIFMTAVCIYGVFDNLLVLYMFNNRVQFFMSASKHYITALSSWNIITICSSCFLFSFRAISFTISPAFEYLTLIIYPVANIAYVGGAWTMLSLTTDQFIAIRYPAFYRSHVKRASRKILVAVAISAIAFGLPRALEVQACRCNLPSRTKASVHLFPTKLLGFDQYYFGYRLICHIIGITLGVLVSQASLTTATILAIRRQRSQTIPIHTKHHRSRRKLGRSEQGSLKSLRGKIRLSRRRRSSRIYSHGAGSSGSQVALLVQFIKSIISYIIPTIIDLREYHHWATSAKSMGAASLDSRLSTGYLVDISNSLVVIQASLNMCIYAAFGSRLRAAILKKLPGGKRRKLKRQLRQLMMEETSITSRRRHQSIHRMRLEDVGLALYDQTITSSNAEKSLLHAIKPTDV